ncbi:MAG: 4Fe-4S binding protein [Candidatus Margulisiibacteriota bacterium]
MHHQNKKPDFEQLKRGGAVKLKEKDMFSVWVRAICSNMNAKKLRAVADLAAEFGRGYILFTTRQFPIIPHIHIKDLEEVRGRLGAVELMLDHCGNMVRSADVCYGPNICPHALQDPISLGEKIDQYWRNDPGGHKIKISISGCRRQCTSPRVLSDLGFIGTERGYEAYIGGRLGLNPFVGIKVAENLSEDASVKLIDNFLVLIRSFGKEGERSADLVKRLGEEKIISEVNKNIGGLVRVEPFACDTKLGNKTDKIILRIRATSGEVTSPQVQKIADISEKYGLGFVHFTLRGSPELPGIEMSDLPKIRCELAEVGLAILDNGTDNLQSCFGGYCTNGIVDSQGLLKKIEALINKLGINDLNIKVSAAGCPNSCAISTISDIGFWGVIEPNVDKERCNGCGICARACKAKAIEIKDKRSLIDLKQCKGCMDCINACPFGSIVGGKRGFAIVVGGLSGEETRLGKVIAEFVSEEKTLQITERILKLMQKKNKNAAGVLDEIGLDRFKEAVL